MPDLSGNIPEHVFYGSISSELLRIARATLRYEDFIPRCQELILRMIKQGAMANKILKTFDMMHDNHIEAFVSFNKPTSAIKHDFYKHL